MRVLNHSTITMPPGSNTIEGDGKVGRSRTQVVVDETSAYDDSVDDDEEEDYHLAFSAGTRLFF